MDTNSIMSYLAIAMSIGTLILGIANHRRARSSCCGYSGSVQLDIEATTPTTKDNQEPLVHNSEIVVKNNVKSEIVAE
jgi:hypothetical protein